MATNILIVEDEPAIQDLVSYTLKQAGFETCVVATGEEALNSINQSIPILIILDWMLPGIKGIDLAKKIRSTQRTKMVPIVFLTAKSIEEDKLQGLDVGADDYITKPFSPRELVARVKTILRRLAPQATDEICAIYGLTLDPTTHEVTAEGELLSLGPTEYKLLHFLMTHPERVYTRSQLLDYVWGDHVFVEERTVDVHIRRLRQQLEKSKLDTLIKTVRGAGYRLSKKTSGHGI